MARTARARPAVPIWLLLPVGLVALFAGVFLAVGTLLAIVAGAYLQAAGAGALAAVAFALGAACNRGIHHARQARREAAANAAWDAEMAPTLQRIAASQAEVEALVAQLGRPRAAGARSAAEEARLAEEAERRMQGLDEALEAHADAWRRKL